MRKGPKVLTTGGTYPWSFETQLFHIGKPNHCDNGKAVEVMTSTLGSVVSLLVA